MKRILLFVCICCALLACKGSKNNSATLPKENKIRATVINMTGLDGCGFLLELESGEKLIPINMSEDFFKDKMKVWITYVPANTVTICMAGKCINIVTIEKRKEKE